MIQWSEFSMGGVYDSRNAVALECGANLYLDGSYMVTMRLTGILKKAGDHYVALCLELNVSSQGESIEEAKKMLEEACGEYVSYMEEKRLTGEIQSVPLEVLREFLMEDVEYVRPSYDWAYSENITFEVEAVA